MRSNEIRNAFLNYFENRDHTVVRSWPVVPYDDPTLLFTNAGMNQFKNIFLGRETRDYIRAVSTQKCIRVSGKHNDLDEVGRDTTHHTFFEMLGNWSFGDYYKKEAIDFAWEFLTKEMGLPKNRLWASVYEDDDEAESLWRRILPSDRIMRCGKKDNFWEMGEVGPCGPCSEIHLDLGSGGCGRPDCGPNCIHCEAVRQIRYVELWNLVFIQFNRDDSGHLEELPAKHVDTGLGLERITAYLQNGDADNYGTDLFQPIVAGIADLTGHAFEEDPTAFRVIADHIRGLAFAIADGAMPSNEGRGYVLRRILRRAARFGRNLGMHDPFIHRLAPILTGSMGGAYPELIEKAQTVQMVIQGEEEGFGKTLDRGIEIFEEFARSVQSKGARLIPGSDAFKLYDTYGFPLDLTQLMAEERGLSVETTGFEEAMAAQRQRARAASSFSGPKTEETEWQVVSQGVHSRFVGYHALESSVRVRKMRAHGDDVDLILDATPFYAESGGQVGDRGQLIGDGVTLEVFDTISSEAGTVHRARPIRENPTESLTAADAEETRKSAFEVLGDLCVLGGKTVFRAVVDAGHRAATTQNHTATHLLHRALRQTLGDHVHQAGSLVTSTRLRFDFSHFSAISDRDLETVERRVNAQIRKNLPVDYFEKPIDEARQMGATAIFGEKYGEIVRVVKMGDYTMELCGGTHVGATGQIGFFRIASESSIASGVRRIEAVTGEGAEEVTRIERTILFDMERILTAGPSELVDRTQKLLAQNKVLEKELDRMRRTAAGSEMADLIHGVSTVSGVRVVASKVKVGDMNAFRELADTLRGALGSGVGLIGTILNDKVSLIAVVTDDLIRDKGFRAGDLVKEVAQVVGGSGGGKPHMAQAGGKHPEKLDEALGKLREIVARQLG
ncbi:MAG: alanine--tRNA ligase [Candidatus Latescibacterota bacterium]